MERYIPDDGHRAWRLLSVPTTGTQTIFQAWQDTTKNYPGYGTLITSPLHNGSNGFDSYSNSPSMLIHDQGGASGPSWTTIPLTNTNSTRLDSRPGYMLFIRGDRNATPSNSLHAATTLRSTGTLRQGTQSPITVSATGSGYTLVGNPFASAIDFESIAATTNLNQNYQLWDANLGGLFGVGGFRLVERTGVGIYEITPAPIGSTTAQNNSMRYINSGQAFFLKASGSNAGVVFTENSKATAAPFINPFRERGTEQQLIANLMTVNSDNTSYLADGIKVRFDNTFSAEVTEEDVVKINNFGENVASRRAGNLLIVERRPEVNITDTIFLNLTNTTSRNYRFEIEGKNLPATLTAYLLDGYSGTQTPLSLTSTNNISFSVTADVTSAAADRFKIVFKTNSPLPVTLQTVKAYQLGNGIMVEWNVQNETAIKQYDVEKSADGITFSHAATQVATGNNLSSVKYNWIDGNPLNGNNFYRIGSTGINGEVKYSPIIKVVTGKGKADFKVYPNPITNNTIQLQFINQPTGKYRLRLLNNLGQVVFVEEVAHQAGSSTEPIRLHNSVAEGHYTLDITGPNKSKRVIRVSK